MGQKLSFFEDTGYQIAMLGLDNAGKSTIIYRLKIDCYIQQAPTIGFNCEKFRPISGSAKGQTFTIWDIGGQEKIRPLWRTYVRQADAVIFVIDSSDHERFDEARIELASLLQQHDFPDIPILTLANKQDLSDAYSSDEIEKIIVTSAVNKRTSHILSCCGVTGEGLDDIFHVIHHMITQSRLHLIEVIVVQYIVFQQTQKCAPLLIELNMCTEVNGLLESELEDIEESLVWFLMPLWQPDKSYRLRKTTSSN